MGLISFLLQKHIHGVIELPILKILKEIFGNYLYGKKMMVLVYLTNKLIKMVR